MTDRPSTPLDKLIRPPAMMTDPPSPGGTDRDDPPASLEEIEQRLQAEVDETLHDIETGGNYEIDAGRFAALGTLAAAMRDVRQVRTTPLAAAAPPVPFDVDTLCARVWNAVQDAGAPTAASDAAVDAIREIVGGEA